MDPINTALRWQGTVTAYSVPGPNSLWHIGEYITSTKYSMMRSAAVVSAQHNSWCAFVPILSSILVFLNAKLCKFCSCLCLILEVMFVMRSARH